MKNKIAILALCTGLLAGMTAQAQDIEVVENSQKVVFSDKISPNSLGICFVVKKGESIEDNSKVYALRNATSDQDGKIEFSFVMPEMRNDVISDGEYDLYIKESGKDAYKADLDFVYASLDTRTKLLNSIKGLPQDETKVQVLKTILENPANLTALKAIGCATDFYKDGTAAGICEIITDFGSVTQKSLKKVYNLSSVKDDFAGANKDKVDKLLEVISPEFESIEYNDITDEDLTAWLSEYFQNNTYSDKKYEEANILYKFNTYVSDKIDDLFLKYDDTTGITSDERYIAYSNLSSKATVNGKISESLSKKPAMSVSSLLDVVTEAIAAVAQDSPGGGGTGGGGGGGSAPNKQPILSGVPSDASVDLSAGSQMGSLSGLKDLHKAEWSRKAVESLVKAGIIAGDGDGNFRPNDYISREEYVKMLVIATGKYNKNATCDFKDVSKNAWYYSYVASAKQYGLTNGISENEFGTGRALTRQDMAVLSLKAKGSVSKVRDDVAFADAGEIAAYAKEAVSKLYMSGAVNGMGNNMFAPLGQATRAECAQIIFNLFLK